MSDSLPVVLIVDDSATLRSIVRVHLMGCGVRFAEADSAEAALARCKSGRVDLIVLDRNLPGMNGIELLRILRSGDVPGMTGVPVILLTGDPSDEVEKEAIDAGVQAFVRKPVNASGLNAAVQRLLPGK
jgi:two-component system, chemotaxis family, chemotaxis protein CheY